MTRLEPNSIYNGNCFDLLPLIPDGSIDCIITDPPYNTTACKWDVAIDLETLFREFERIIKPNGAVVVFCSFKFGVDCVNACKGKLKFRYDLVWEKSKPVGFLDANRRQLRQHENVLVFSINGYTSYNPQMTEGKPYKFNNTKHRYDGYGSHSGTQGENDGSRFPTSIIYGINGLSDFVHPTQKPVSILEYLVATYSNEGDLILDPFLGSGTTAVACQNLNRNFIGMELHRDYVDIGERRLKEARNLFTKAETQESSCQVFLDSSNQGEMF